MKYNIRIEKDRAELEALGFAWVTIISRGDSIGTVVSKHKSVAAAERAVRGRELTVVSVLYSVAY